MTSTLLQCRVPSAPPTAAAKGKLLSSDFTVQKCAAWDSSVWLISIMLASAALIDSHLHEFSCGKLFSLEIPWTQFYFFHETVAL